MTDKQVMQLFLKRKGMHVFPEEDGILTGQRLKLDETAATAAVQNFVLGDCRMCLPMGSDLGQTVTGVVHFEKWT